MWLLCLGSPSGAFFPDGLLRGEDKGGGSQILGYTDKVRQQSNCADKTLSLKIMSRCHKKNAPTKLTPIPQLPGRLPRQGTYSEEAGIEQLNQPTQYSCSSCDTLNKLTDSELQSLDQVSFIRYTHQHAISFT